MDLDKDSPVPAVYFEIKQTIEKGVLSGNLL
jgi:hypothetical protein